MPFIWQCGTVAWSFKISNDPCVANDRVTSLFAGLPCLAPGRIVGARRTVSAVSGARAMPPRGGGGVLGIDITRCPRWGEELDREVLRPPVCSPPDPALASCLGQLPPWETS
jgi:hypothetical protein